MIGIESARRAAANLAGRTGKPFAVVSVAINGVDTYIARPCASVLKTQKPVLFAYPAKWSKSQRADFESRFEQ